MAQVIYGEIVKGASGSIGGTVFSRNRFGPYIRARSMPVNPNTGLQQLVRNAFSSATEQWNSVLTEAQRVAWNLYGSSVVMKSSLGEDIFLTGFNHFVRSNSGRLRSGLDIVADGPVIFSLPETDATFSVVASEAGQDVDVTFDEARPWVSEDNAFLFLEQMVPVIASRSYLVGRTRALSGIVGDNAVPPTTPHNTGVEFAVAEGQKMIVAGRILRADGRISEPFQSSLTIAA